MKVLQLGKYAVYVYREIGGSHHLPHCHVRWPDDSVVVALPSLDVLAGGHLPGEVREFLVEHLDEVWEAWNQLN